MIAKTLIKNVSLEQIQPLIEESFNTEKPDRIFPYNFSDTIHVFVKLKNKIYIELHYFLGVLPFPQNPPFSLAIFS
jgi:hypothetical protein